MARRARPGEAARGEHPESLPMARWNGGQEMKRWSEAERSNSWQTLFRPQHRTCKVSATLVKGTPALISRQGPLTRKFTWTQWQKYPSQPEVFLAEKWCIAYTTAARRPPPREWRQPWSLHRQKMLWRPRALASIGMQAERLLHHQPAPRRAMLHHQSCYTENELEVGRGREAKIA